MRLIISEKPSAAKKIAEALGGYRTIKNGNSYYYEVSPDLIVAPAVGHLYGLEPLKKGWDYPIFEVGWKKTSTRKGFEYAKGYLQNLEKLGKAADEIIIATDYDREGGVIGFNILKFAVKMKHPEKALRMKFSTLTKNELKKSYDNAHVHNKFETGMALAGITRHYLDWYWGINLSRALVQSIKRTGQFKVLSTGRVQGPALKLLVDREREIKSFSSAFYYRLVALIENQYEAKDGEFEDVKKALDVFLKVKGPAKVDAVEKSRRNISPRPPFNLTDLQTEASRVYRITPKETLDLAQKLYEAGTISYPRTSSHDLPKELDIGKILSSLAYFIPQATKLLGRKAAKGTKTDPAHPAIYPTGEKLTDGDLKQRKIYELIAKRFVASFSDPAVRESTKIHLNLNGIIFLIEGQKTITAGFTEIYSLGLKEVVTPKVKKGDILTITYIQLNREQKNPPKRFTEAGLLKQMERLNLGTKATRADIIQRLYFRGYIEGKSIKVLPLGENVIAALENVVPRMLSIELTKSFEDRMEKIQDGKDTMEQVLKDGKIELMKILQEFKNKELEIGKKLMSGGVKPTPSKFTSGTVKTPVKRKKPSIIFGACPSCGKDVGQVISMNDKRYAACTACDKTWGLPQRGTLKVLKEVCRNPKCKFKRIQIKRKDTQFTLCIEHGFN